MSEFVIKVTRTEGNSERWCVTMYLEDKKNSTMIARISGIKWEEVFKQIERIGLMDAAEIQSAVSGKTPVKVDWFRTQTKEG